VNLLLDTHSIIWFLMGDRRLSHRARRAIEFGRNWISVSAISGYELVYKSLRGKLEFPIGADIVAEIRNAHFTVLSVSLEHAIEAAQLGGPHGDPWDRVLVAQARIENLIVVTRDRAFAEYGVRTLW